MYRIAYYFLRLVAIVVYAVTFKRRRFTWVLYPKFQCFLMAKHQQWWYTIKAWKELR